MLRRFALAALAVAVGVGSAHAACCYFAAKDKDILQPGQKAFICWYPSEKVESFTVQPKFEGNALDFGMVIPTPSRPKLDEMPRDFFKDLAIYTILMPLPQAIYYDLFNRPVPEEDAMRGGGPPMPSAPTAAPGGPPKVRVLEAGVVGSLDYKIIVADEGAALFTWLKDNGYSYGGDEATLQFYIDKKWFFTVMKIDSKAMKKNPDGTYLGEVTPTRFTFESEQCIYPLRITAISVKDKTDALFYVQSAKQMDLEGDLSWMHSYRIMYLTYVLGCGAGAEEQKELEVRNRWMQEKKSKDPRFETCKLEWARKLGAPELAILEDPLRNYAQMGQAGLPAGGRFITLDEFLKEIWDEYKAAKGDHDDAYAKQQLSFLREQYPATKGSIVKVDRPSGYLVKYNFFPNREAPAEDVKGLSRLKGHLQNGKYLTKFRKEIRKDEMAQDLVLVPVPDGQEQDYVRIMPTSPP